MEWFDFIDQSSLHAAGCTVYIATFNITGQNQDDKVSVWVVVKICKIFVIFTCFIAFPWLNCAAKLLYVLIMLLVV